MFLSCSFRWWDPMLNNNNIMLLNSNSIINKDFLKIVFFSFVFSYVRLSVCLSFFYLSYFSFSSLSWIFNRFDVSTDVFISNIYSSVFFILFAWAFRSLYFLFTNGHIWKRKEKTPKQIRICLNIQNTYRKEQIFFLYVMYIWGFIYCVY